MMGSMLCYFFAIHYSGMAIASALLGISPVVILILAIILLKERISLLSALAAIIALVGILCITGINTVFNSKYFLGELLAISSAIFLSFNFILQKKYLQKFNGKQLVFYQSLFQLPMLLPIVLIDFGTLTYKSFTAVLMLGLVCTVFAYTLIYNGVRQVDAQKIGILQSIEYVMPILFGIVIFNEIPDVYVLTGMGLIILSCVLVGFKPRNVRGE
jgi:drug/metabolite transporter (DMT)-like permease